MTVLKKFFENKEQIEVSKFYENYLSHMLAVQEWLDGKILPQRFK
jgi:predicted unusual protein kinase regulating ubiquinone biosynthesis (AarF/ABC1/UbiB family)